MEKLNLINCYAGLLPLVLKKAELLKTLAWILCCSWRVSFTWFALILENEFYTCPQTCDVCMLKKKLFPCSTCLYRKEGIPLIKAQWLHRSLTLSCKGFMCPFLCDMSAGVGVVIWWWEIGRKDACREDGEKLRLGEGYERNFIWESGSFDQRGQLFGT